MLQRLSSAEGRLVGKHNDAGERLNNVAHKLNSLRGRVQPLKILNLQRGRKNKSHYAESSRIDGIDLLFQVFFE